MRITLCGAAGEVTGSGYLVETGQSRVLVDFGIFQGSRSAETKNRTLGAVVPPRLDAIVLTHAHLDHTGRLPMLPSRGFRAPIFGTSATLDFTDLLLRDAAFLQEADLARISRQRQRAGKQPLDPLYGQGDVEKLMPHFRPIEYDQPKEVAKGVTVRLVDAGHILGSASIEMTVEERGARRVIVFSGDIGPSNSPLLCDPVPLASADLVFLESTYGDRDHRTLEATLEEFQGILKEAERDRSRVMIPAFAIGRTQQVLYHLAEFVRGGMLQECPIYLDSPMAIRATRLYEKHQHLLDEEAKGLIRGRQFSKDLRNLHLLETGEQSRELNDGWEMAVIVAGSGMCDGGRILHHFKHNLWKRNAAVVLVGFQAEGTLGRRLVEGSKEVRIHGQRILVRAKIHTLNGFSAHAGRTELLGWFSHLVADRPRVVLTHGEQKAREALARGILERHGIVAELPEGPGSIVDLD